MESDITIQADEERFRSLVENFFPNVVEHGGDGVTVRVGALADDQGFYVADDGPGVPEGDRERIFDSGYTTTQSGTGLGLAIVDDVAETRGWSCTVTESETGGAWFEFTGVESGAA
jgi:signal transduction histidine kinase